MHIYINRQTNKLKNGVMTHHINDQHPITPCAVKQHIHVSMEGSD